MIKTFCIMTGLLAAAFLQQASAATTVNFSGNLTHGECQINTADIQVNFLTLGAKDLATNGRSAEKPFQISLSGCQLGKDLQIQFSGTPATAAGLEGTVKVSEGDMADKIGIALVEYIGGVRNELPFNTTVAGGEQTFNSTPTNLKFGAYVKASRAVMEGNAGLAAGNFNAIVNFTVIYP